VFVLQLVVLALVQGITEFLPISSSAHLVLVPVVTGWPDQGLVIDVAVHVGTLLAVLLYFRRDVAAAVLGFLRLFAGGSEREARLALQIALASIPAFAAGFALHALAPAMFRADGANLAFAVAVIAWANLVFALALWLADRYGPTRHDAAGLGYGGALAIGLAQALALIPGTSRSGVTMTAGRALGLTREEAARFSMLLAIPIILGAGALATLDVVEAGDARLGADALWAGGLAFLSALAAIALLMRWLRHAGFLPFVIYRLVLGIALLAWLYA
jgi:undecaprenyl-diphosphatase